MIAAEILYSFITFKDRVDEFLWAIFLKFDDNGKIIVDNTYMPDPSPRNKFSEELQKSFAVLDDYQKI